MVEDIRHLMVMKRKDVAADLGLSCYEVRYAEEQALKKLRKGVKQHRIPQVEMLYGLINGWEDAAN